MKARLAINGFRRISRLVFRKAIMDETLDVVAINARYSAETLAPFIKYDTFHSKFNSVVTPADQALLVVTLYSY